MIKIPTYLSGEAKRFWQVHAKRLYLGGMLTEADVESFVLLCEIWAMIRGCNPEEDSREAIRYIGLVKQYFQISRQFGMMPKDRKQSKIETTKQEEDEFGL